MSKGTQTREAILATSADLASRIGLQALTIGNLATEVDMSKSGLFAHFGSKEALQVETLNAAAERFVDRVVRPALKAPRGEPRIRAVFEEWLNWGRKHSMKGCLFLQSTAEFDDQPGAIRDVLEHQQRAWMKMVSGAVDRAKTEGHFRDDVNSELFAFEFYALLMGYQHAHRMMRDPNAETFLRAAFDRLLASCH